MTPGTGKFFPDKKPKTSNIIARMREELCDLHDDETCELCEIFTAAINEIERLRELGDRLADTGGQYGFDDALDAWKEYREQGNNQ